MKLIVALGNPGIEYENTRHNMGFIVLDKYAHDNGIEFKEKFNGLYAKTMINNEIVIFLKPLSYMNLSGTVVKKYVDYYKIDVQDILIIQDDIDLPIGKIKLKYKGSDGGHNGIKNIILNLKTEEFKRFKIGIGRKDGISIKDYVIGKLNEEDKLILQKILSYSNNIIDDFIIQDFEKIMSKYNGAEYEVN